MTVAGDERRARDGLCATCANAKIVTSSRGSEFVMCQLSFTDPDFPRYPPLPVLTCRGYQADTDNGYSSTALPRFRR